MSKKSTDPWAIAVKSYLKSELVKRNLTYGDLVKLLAEIGVEESEVSLASKFSRGTFSAAFCFQVLTAVKVENEVGTMLKESGLLSDSYPG